MVLVLPKNDLRPESQYRKRMRVEVIIMYTIGYIAMQTLNSTI